MALLQANSSKLTTARVLSYHNPQVEIKPLEHELAHLVNLQTSASAPVASVRGGVAGVRDPGARVNVTSMVMRREQVCA